MFGWAKFLTTTGLFDLKEAPYGFVRQIAKQHESTDITTHIDWDLPCPLERGYPDIVFEPLQSYRQTPRAFWGLVTFAKSIESNALIPPELLCGYLAQVSALRKQHGESRFLFYTDMFVPTWLREDRVLIDVTFVQGGFSLSSARKSVKSWLER